MALTGSQILKLTDAIVSAYTREELRLVLRTRMDESFEEKVPNNPLKIQVFDFVEWANRVGRENELVRCIYEPRKQNEALHAVFTEIVAGNQILSIIVELEQQTSEYLVRQPAAQAIPYQEREADRYLRKSLENSTASPSAYNSWIVVGSAGSGKTTLLLQLAKWCREQNAYLPIWLNSDLLRAGGHKLDDLLKCRRYQWGEKLQQLAEVARKPLVVFIDSLESAVVDDEGLKYLGLELSELMFNTRMVCSCRPADLKYIQRFGLIEAERVELERLTRNQVRQVLNRSLDKYHISMRDMHPDMIEMCRDPVNLQLLLQASEDEPLPQVLKPNKTWLQNKFWDRRVERLRSNAPINSHLARLSKEQIVAARVKLVNAVAQRLLYAHSYGLPHEQFLELIPSLAVDQALSDLRRHGGDVFELVSYLIFGLESDGILTEEDEVRFWHDSFADYVICRNILLAEDWPKKLAELLDRVAAPFFFSIIVSLVLQSRDEGRSDIENQIYGTLITYLEKKDSQIEINRSWGATYALMQLAPLWVERLCGSIESGCPQRAASSIAAVLADAGSPELVVPTLIGGMKRYHLKKRFIDSLGAYRDPGAVESLLNLLTMLMATREDDELIETIAMALHKIGDARAQGALARLEDDHSFPISARRIARRALLEITHESRYLVAIPYMEAELIEGLRLFDTRNPALYSDWKLVERTARIIVSEASQGRYPTRGVEEALLHALDHQHEGAQHSVVSALIALNDADSALHALEAKVTSRYTPDGTRRLIVETLGKIALRFNTSQYRYYICEMLRRIAMSDENPQVRREATDRQKFLECG